jgi:hypothetical protein
MLARNVSARVFLGVCVVAEEVEEERVKRASCPWRGEVGEGALFGDAMVGGRGSPSRRRMRRLERGPSGGRSATSRTTAAIGLLSSRAPSTKRRVRRDSRGLEAAGVLCEAVPGGFTREAANE